MGTVWEVLWTNPSPTSAFGEQTIPIPTILNYDMIAVEADNMASWVFIRTDRIGEPFAMLGPQWKAIPNYRTAQINTTPTLGVLITTCYVGSGTSQSATQMIPYRIYGIKGIS